LVVALADPVVDRVDRVVDLAVGPASAAARALRVVSDAVVPVADRVADRVAGVVDQERVPAVAAAWALSSG
jgi:hypothetical protein